MTINIKTIVDAFTAKTDYVDYNLADHINKIQSALDALAYMSFAQAGFANTETLSGNKTLTDDDAVLQFLNPNAADRDVSLPALAVTNHPVLVMNTNGSNYLLTVKNAGGTVIRIVPAGKAFWFVSDGNQWICVSFDLYKTISPLQITANQNNYNPTGAYEADILRLDEDAAYNITGLAGGSAGRMKIVHNIGSYTLTLKNEDGGSSAANRFAIGSDFELEANKSLLLIYDAVSSRWRLVGGGGGGGGSSDIIGQKRLSLQSSVPVSTTAQTAKTTVYWTDGTTNLSVAVPNTTSTPFDVFYDPAGDELETVNWTNDTTRATALTREAGRLVKSGDVTKLYLGTGRTTGVSGQCEDSLTARYLWNYYNRVSRPLERFESATSWNNTSSSIVAANGGSTANRVQVVIGVAEDAIVIDLLTSLTPGSTSAYGYAGIGEDKTDGFDGTVMGGGGGATSAWFVFAAQLRKIPAAGHHYYSWNERGTSSTTVTFYGVGSVSFLRGGLTGTVLG